MAKQFIYDTAKSVKDSFTTQPIDETSKFKSIYQPCPIAVIEYSKKFDWPQITKEPLSEESHQEGIWITTERFTAEPLYSAQKEFDNFSKNIQQLYEVTFGDSTVMNKFGEGTPKEKDAFQANVIRQSSRWDNGYKFSAFIVTDNYSGDVVGYEIIGNSDEPGKGEIAYLFNKKYHNNTSKGGTIKDVGYETAGSLVLEYGLYLFKSKAFVNQSPKELEDGDKGKKVIWEGGQQFTTITATARLDNIGSWKILQKLGFNYVKDSFKFGHDRYVFDKSFKFDPSISSYLETGYMQQEQVSELGAVTDESCVSVL